MRIVIGCNYHTTWQADKSMRFVLKEVRGKRAKLATRATKRTFWTDIEDLIFIESKYNIEKANRLHSEGVLS